MLANYAWIVKEEIDAKDAHESCFCKGTISHFKVPKYWQFVTAAEDSPTTETGLTKRSA